jgi:O-antigen ligase
MFKPPLPPLWMALWGPLLALAWLLPNHYYPWATFHSDAWVAVMLALVSASVIMCSATPVAWHRLTVVIALLAMVPTLQFAAGLIPFSGQAWLYSAYVLGLLLALLVGARWEAATPGRAADGLFMAIGIAALVSVGLQLRQWLGLATEMDDALQIWTGEFSPGRPSANLGQPNQLATLLLWALLGTVWAVLRQKVRPVYAVLVALFLVFGVVLTQSRIASIALLALTIAAWVWRRLLPPRGPWVMTWLLLYFVVCTLGLQHLSDLLGLDVQIRSASLGGASTQLRLKAYRLFLDAVTQQPWFGYGWDQLAVAQMAVAQNHGTLTSFFLHSHNLFLDLVLWCGIPIGGSVSAVLLGWLLCAVWQVDSREDAVLVLFLLVVGLHAMVELPLHHAYLLLPTGLVMGMLNQRQHKRVLITMHRWWVLGLWLGICVLLGTIMRDYLRVDQSFRTYRLEAAHIGRLPPEKPPEVLLLNHMRAFIVNARTEVHPDISAEELEQLRGVTTSFPTPANLFNFAKALAFLHRPEEAAAWIAKVQKVQPAEFNPDMRRIWEAQATAQPAMAAVKWPDLDEPVAPSVAKP